MLWGKERITTIISLFPGPLQEKRFATDLANILHSRDPDELIALGIEPTEIDKHSARKGGPTLVRNLVDGPEQAVVMARGEWANGVTYAYFKQNGIFSVV